MNILILFKITRLKHLINGQKKGWIAPAFFRCTNYYFNKPDEKKLAELDKLMLTQGYRRFSYKDLLENKLI